MKQADFESPFTIKTDASIYAIGAALRQGEGPNEHPIEYASRLLNSLEQIRKDALTQALRKETLYWWKLIQSVTKKNSFLQS